MQDPVVRRHRDCSGGGETGIDRPFLDPVRMVPVPGLGPLAVGLGIALVAAGTIFGAATVAVGVVPLAWGALLWLRDAVAEHADLDGRDDRDTPDEPLPAPGTTEPGAMDGGARRGAPAGPAR